MTHARPLWLLSPLLIPACFVGIDDLKQSTNGANDDASGGIDGNATGGSDGGGQGGAGDAATGGTASGGQPAAGGGSATGGSTQGSGTGGTEPDRALLDDLEDGDGSIVPVAGRGGFWITSVDGSAGVINHSSHPTPDALSPPRADSERAMHFFGTGFSNWGALIGFSFTEPQGAYDVSEYTGVRFWVRGSGSLQLTLPLIATTKVEEGGTCTLGDNCGNNYSAYVPVSTTWTEAEVPFSSLTQSTEFGEQHPLDLTTALQVQFFFAKNQAFDVWIDDVRLY